MGETDAFGHYVVDREEIVEFASEYDPQPFHLDEEAARESMFGGLVASGWHIAAMTMGMLVDNYFADSRALGAAGVDELRFIAPVPPGDELFVEREVLATEPWDDERGLVESRVATSTDDGTTVLRWLERCCGNGVRTARSNRLVPSAHAGASRTKARSYGEIGLIRGCTYFQECSFVDGLIGQKNPTESGLQKITTVRMKPAASVPRPSIHCRFVDSYRPQRWTVV